MAGTLHQQINLRQTSPSTYTASWHQNWVLGSTLNGGYLAAVIIHAAVTHLKTDPTLIARGQSDLLNLHIEYMRACARQESTVEVVPLKIGSTECLLQLQLFQQGQLRMMALITTTNFDKTFGPSAPTDWALYPPPNHIPDFDLVESHNIEPNQLPATLAREVLTFTHRAMSLNPRQGFTLPGVCDAWNRFLGGERVDATYLGLLSDLIPSMSDTLLRSGLYNAHAFHETMVHYAVDKLNRTVALDLRFAKRLPTDVLRWVFTGMATKVMDRGKMAIEVTVCNETMDLVCEAHQSTLVLEAEREFNRDKTASSSL